MRLKYFLRGLGIGVVVTTIILSIAHAASDKMSDADIIERAKELGMVYDSLFDENSGNKETETETAESTTAEGETAGSEVTEENNSQSETEVPQNQTTEAQSESVEEITDNEAAGSDSTKKDEQVTDQTTTEAVTDASKETETETSTADDSKELATQIDANGVITFQLEVVRGMKSAEVAALVEAAGIVDSAKELDSFLIAGDYDNQINIGVFTITSDMSYQDIANIITGK